MVKNLPANEGEAGSIPGWEDPLEKEMATHSSILAWEIPWTEEPGGLQSVGLQWVGHDLVTEQTHHTDLVFLEARSLKWVSPGQNQGVGRAMLPPEAFGENPCLFQLLEVAYFPRLVAPFLSSEGLSLTSAFVLMQLPPLRPSLPPARPFFLK